MRLSTFVIRLIFVSAALTAPRLVIAQAADPVPIVRTRAQIKLDGKPNEEAWENAPKFPLIMYTPTAGGHTTDSSVVKLLYDDQYLYAAGWFYTPDSRTIRPGLFGRDQMGPEDHFMIILDAANDNQTGHVFTTVPSGARTDYAIGGDGQQLDRNWNGYWDGESTRDEHGWYSEMRIPLSTLRFQTVGGRATMGLIIHRYTAGRSEFDTYPALNRSFAAALFRPSIAGKIYLSEVEARSPLYLTPYALGGVSGLAVLRTNANKYSIDQKVTHEAGFDAKFGITSSLVADVTANTDFAQVEADNQQVNLTRFSLFFPEKRQFFLERSDLFAVQSGNGDLLFHSRTIGIGPSGEALRIYGGARVVGRVGKWDVGALSMQTAQPRDDGTENDAAVRVRRSVINSGSYVGGLVTTRLASAGHHNILATADAVVRPFSNDFITLQTGRSIDSNNDSSSAGESGMARIAWDRRANGDLQYSASYRRIGRDFNPGLGFQSRSDISQTGAGIGYGWLPGSRTAFSAVSPYFLADVVNRNSGQLLDSRLLHTIVSANLKSGHSGYVYASQEFERLDNDFRIASTAMIPRGNYTSTYFGAGLFSNSRRKISGSLTATVGDIYDGTRAIFTIGPRWNASEHLQVGTDLTFTRLRFDSRDQSVNSDIARLRVQYAYDSRVSVASFVQYNRAARAAAANVRLRFQFAEGQDLWVVYNDLLNTDRDPLSPAAPGLPLSKARTFLVKYTHTLVR